MGTPVHRDILFAYLAAKVGDPDEVVKAGLAESIDTDPTEVLSRIGAFFNDLAYSNEGEWEVRQARKSALLNRLLSALDAIQDVGPMLRQHITEQQILAMCETYQHLADRWNWTEGPASQMERHRDRGSKPQPKSAAPSTDQLGM